MPRADRVLDFPDTRVTWPFTLRVSIATGQLSRLLGMARRRGYDKRIKMVMSTADAEALSWHFAH